MRSTITLLIGLSTVLLFLSIHGIPYVNGQASNSNNKTSNGNSVSQTENLDPFLARGSDNNINTGSANNPSQANDGSTDKNNNDGSTNKNNHEDKKGSDNGKSSEAAARAGGEDNKDSKPKPNDIPFP